MKKQSSCKPEKRKRDDLNLGFPRTCKAWIPTKSIRSLRRAMKQLALASAVLAVLSLLISSYENELYYQNSSESTHLTDFLRSSVLFISVFQLAFVNAYYWKQLELKVAYKEISRRSRVWDDPELLRFFIIEVLLNSLCIPPFLSFSFTASQLNTHQTLSVDDIFYMVSFLKLYHLVKLLRELSSSNSERARMYCHLMNQNPDSLFILKTHVRKYPFLCLVSLLGLMTLVLGLTLRISERSIYANKLNNVWNGFWAIGVTQTTVGYGEIHPLSHIGRVLCFFAALMGIFLHSYSLLIINRQLILTRTELCFYKKVKLSKRSYDALRKEAALLIQTWWRRKNASGIDRFKLFCNFMAKTNEFSMKRRQIITQKNQSLHHQIRETSKNACAILNACSVFLDQTSQIEDKSTNLVFTQFSILKKIQSFKRFGGQKFMSSPSNRSMSVKSSVSDRINNRKKRDQALISHFSKLVTKLSSDSGYLFTESFFPSKHISTMRNFLQEE